MVRTSGLIGRRARGQRSCGPSLPPRGGGAVVSLLVAGEAGIGKTALVEHAIGRRFPIVLRGAARASRAAPFEPLVAAIRSHPRWPAVAGDVLVGPWGERRRPWTPSVRCSANWRQSRRGHATGAAATRSDDRGDPEATRDAICWLIDGIARIEPLAIVLDDLQRADHATIDALPVLARSAATGSLLIIGIYRSDELPRVEPGPAPAGRAAARRPTARDRPRSPRRRVRPPRWRAARSVPGPTTAWRRGCSNGARACRCSWKSWLPPSWPTMRSWLATVSRHSCATTCPSPRPCATASSSVLTA